MNARNTSASTPTTTPSTRERAVPAVTRAASILRVLARSEAPLGVQAIARELKLVPSTCLHILRALVAEELVAFDPDTKRYRLDVGILSLARHLLKKGGFATTSRIACRIYRSAWALPPSGSRSAGWTT
ncbi:helix-turn-helix domain-containing protein [Micromonospora sp. STR1s_5]|nr:helix-turn-helix domain-containing protein [Micromonospora sp. STR1s_5]